MSKLILVIAGTGQGKTTKIKELISGKSCCVFDVNGEYPDLSTNINDYRCRFFSSNIKDFLKLVQQKHGGSICVFEEATGFFSGAAAPLTKQVIVGKRHPVEAGGRNLVFVFHTINSVPPFLLETADYIILGKTGDDLNRVKKKSIKIFPYFYKVLRLPKFQFLNIKNI